MTRFKISLLADENIPKLMVEELRELGVSVEWVNDLSIKGSGDIVILQAANKKKAFLLTDNGKDFFLKDHDFRFHGLTGIKRKVTVAVSDTLKPKVCARCSKLNPSTGKLCSNCFWPVDQSVAIELMDKMNIAIIGWTS